MPQDGLGRAGARVGNAFDDVVGMAPDRRSGLVGGLRQARGHAAAVGPNGLDDRGPARLQAVDQLVGAGAEGRRHGRRDVGQPIRRRIPMALDSLGRARAHLGDPVHDVVGEAADRVASLDGGIGDSLGHAVAVRADRVDDRGLRGVDSLDEVDPALVHAGEQDFARGLDPAVEVADAGYDVVGRPAARVGETGGETVADARDRDGDLGAFRHDPLDGVRAGAVHRGRDILRRRPERGGEPLAGFVQLLAQAIAGRVEFSGDSAVGVGDRVANARTAGRDGFPLIGHLRDERADLALVVGIRALERRHFSLDAGFEFGGAGERPFDAVAHRAEFAADGLRQGRHLLAGDRLRLHQAHRDFGNRPRRLAQFPHAAGERREGEQEEDRPQRRKQEQGRLGPDENLGPRGAGDCRPDPQIRVERAEGRPDERTHDRQDEGRSAWTGRVQSLEYGAHRFAVVIGRRRGGDRGLRLRGLRRRRARSQERRRIDRLRGRLEDRGRRLRPNRIGRRGWRRYILQDRGGRLVVRQVQGALDCRHRRRNRIRRRVLFCHSDRLVPLASTASGRSTRQHFPPASVLAEPTETHALTTSQSNAMPLL